MRLQEGENLLNASNTTGANIVVKNIAGKLRNPIFCVGTGCLYCLHSL